MLVASIGAKLRRLLLLAAACCCCCLLLSVVSDDEGTRREALAAHMCYFVAETDFLL